MDCDYRLFAELFTVFVLVKGCFVTNFTSRSKIDCELHVSYKQFTVFVLVKSRFVPQSIVVYAINKQKSEGLRDFCKSLSNNVWLR